jgi:psp operon transcriptional activator
LIPSSQALQRRKLAKKSFYHRAELGALGDLSAKPFKKAVRIFEIKLIREALIGARYNQKKVARQLGLSYDQFRGVYRKYKKELQEA